MSMYEELRDILLTIPTARLASGGREIVMRCRYCDDSRNRKSAHMYIKLPIDDSLSIFNCFKCHTSGVVTHDKLVQWGAVVDTDTLIKFANYNSIVSKMAKNRKFVDRQVYKLDNTFISDTPLAQAKLRYINKRLGLGLTYNDLIDNKITLGLKDILSSNHINNLTRHPNIIEQLDQGFIGFISQDNAFINMRNLIQGKVGKSIDLRYVNYNIFGKFENTMRYYTLPTTIDLCRTDRIKIHVAEGPFDILSIFYNLRGANKDNSIYSSILGSSYINICKHFINTLKLVNIELHVYIDADISISVVNQLRDICYVFQIPFYLHRNMKPGQKDFGVSLDKIIEQQERVI